jgi:hypothetical protein
MERSFLELVIVNGCEESGRCACYTYCNNIRIYMQLLTRFLCLCTCRSLDWKLSFWRNSNRISDDLIIPIIKSKEENVAYIVPSFETDDPSKSSHKVVYNTKFILSIECVDRSDTICD